MVGAMPDERPRKHRMYVDEVGNPDLGSSDDPNHRYLSLTGVIIDLGDVSARVSPEMEALKTRYFGSHPDEPVVFHRKEMVNRKRPFEALRDPLVEAAFNRDLLALLSDLRYTVITTVIDKALHKERYQVWRFDPYHYCMSILVERYVMWLGHGRSVGDVMSESRGGREDRRLQDSFARIVQNGTDYVSADKFQNVLTSRQLKTKPKSANIAGLQLADLLAHPSYRAMLAERLGETNLGPFGAKIVEILERRKLDRSPTGKIDGWGRKWLP
jgi:hypothetical protein